MRLSVTPLTRFMSAGRRRPSELAERGNGVGGCSEPLGGKTIATIARKRGDFSHGGFVSFSATRVTGLVVRLPGEHRHFTSSKVKTTPVEAAGDAF